MDVTLNDEKQNLREKFKIYKQNPVGDGFLHDKIADGVGHYKDCPYYIIEITNANIRKAKAQIRSSIDYIFKNGEKVKKIAIILNELRWNDTLARGFYKIIGDLLYKKGNSVNEKLKVNHNGREFIFDIYCYLKDFEKYR